MCRRLEFRPGGDVLFEACLSGDARRPRLQILSYWPDAVLLMRRALNRCQPQVRSPACSTGAVDTADRHAIRGQPVRLSANSLRPERRSTDGQTILKVDPAGWKPAPDLLVCRAPLRNRTVDLLLTMGSPHGSVVPGTARDQAEYEPGLAPTGTSPARTRAVATRSATHFDLDRPTIGGHPASPYAACRIPPDVPASCLSRASGTHRLTATATLEENYGCIMALIAP